MSCSYRYPCILCGRPALEGKSCCSQACRNRVPTCEVTGCRNAVEMGSIYKGMLMPPEKCCYKHGGRVHYDGDPQHNFRQKRKCLINDYGARWAPINDQSVGLLLARK